MFIFLYFGVNILRAWNDKKRKYSLLINKNRKTFRPESFKEFMNAPCGRLLTKVVLKDLGKEEEYKNLKYLRNSLRENFLEFIQGSGKTSVYVRNKDGEFIEISKINQ